MEYDKQQQTEQTRQEWPGNRGDPPQRLQYFSTQLDSKVSAGGVENRGRGSAAIEEQKLSSRGV